MLSISSSRKFNIPSSVGPLPPSESVARIQQIALRFAAGQGQLVQGTDSLKVMQEPDGRVYYGIHKNDQFGLRFSELRLNLLEQFGLASDAPVVQIIGDSGKFSPAGTAFAKGWMADKLGSETGALFLWGYTASGAPGPNTADANGIFNDWLDGSDPSVQARAMANIVEFGAKESGDPEKIADTATVINNYGAKAALATQVFYTVYGKAQFGDDIESSDKLTTKAFCLDGGPQSWRQVVNFLSQDIPVAGLFNLRGENNPATFVKMRNDYCKFFSAGEFIYLLRQAVEAEEASGRKVDAKFVNAFKADYLSTRLVFNPDRHDSETKLPLFNAAWDKFVSEKLWTRLGNCTFAEFRPE